jgi:predicted nucleic acid-binding protein
LILVDSSVWIDFFSSAGGDAGDELRRMIEEAEPVALAGAVVAEVLQGLTRDVNVIENFLRQWDLLEPAGFDTYARAAAIFRTARRNGITVATIDALIAAIAIENRASLFTLDKDFSRLAPLAGLRLHVVK